MVIRWKPMDKMEWNAPELRYLIRYRLKKADPKLDMLSSKMELRGKQEENSGKWHEFFVEDPLVVTFWLCVKYIFNLVEECFGQNLNVEFKLLHC